MFEVGGNFSVIYVLSCIARLCKFFSERGIIDYVFLWYIFSIEISAIYRNTSEIRKNFVAFYAKLSTFRMDYLVRQIHSG